jgi:hypothetical protein
MNRPFPLPEDLDIRKARPAVYLYRAAASHARCFVTRSTPEGAARALFGGDVVTDAILKAATLPASTGTPGWAQQLAQSAVDDSIAAIASLSAAAELISRGLKLDLTGIAQLHVPGRTLDATQAGQWVGEGAATPVRALTFTTGAVLSPRKLAVICSMSREIIESSAVEATTRALLSEAAALALDAVLFSTSADDGNHPAGILNGVAALTPTTGGGTNGMAGDVKALIAALAAAGGGLHPIIIASPPQATALKIWAGPHFDIPVLPSVALAAGTIVAVEASSFVSGFGAVPEFSTSKVTVLHMEDTSPSDIVSGTAATPSKSTFQTDAVALKMILHASWGMRAPHVAWIQNVSW